MTFSEHAANRVKRQENRLKGESNVEAKSSRQKVFEGTRMGNR
jgi:hypothetical protein